jgi:Mn2+/Fe2+ NRAMP family transporter
LLPAALVFLILLLNDRKTMGGHTNTRWQNIANVTIVASIVVCSTFYAITTVFPNLFAAK